MTNDLLMIEGLSIAFTEQEIDKCLITSQEVEMIVNDPSNNERCILVRLDDSIYLTGFQIHNPKGKSVHVLCIDNCLKYQSEDDKNPEKRCDCVVFDDVYFCFIELKLNVSSRDQVTYNANKARKQLGRTIQYFDYFLGTGYFGYIREAYTVLPNRFPRRPDQAVRERFFQQYRV